MKSMAGCLLVLLLSLGMAVEAAKLIAHPSVPQDQLSKNAARLVFSLRLTRWPDGSGVRVFVLPDNAPLHRQFSKQRLGLFPHQLRRVWDRQLYTGTGQVPVEVASEEEMLSRVRSTPGAVGYLSEKVSDENIKELDIE